MKKLLMVVALGLAGCSTQTPSVYSNYADNTIAIRTIEPTKVQMTTIDDQSQYDENCRMVGPIRLSGGRTLAGFIRDSFNDELKFAGAFATDGKGVELNAKLSKAVFSSSEGLVDGWWDLAWTVLNPANGKSVSAASKYEFSTNFVGEIACKNVAEALVPAVQQLINKTVTSPEFKTLLAR